MSEANRNTALELKCKELANRLHASVNHTYDGHPYSYHLDMVNAEVMKFIHLVPPYYKTIVICAGYLHDSQEDTRTTHADLIKEIKKIIEQLQLDFNVSKREIELYPTLIANIVYAVTNEKGKTRDERANSKYYRGIRQCYLAKYVKLCDRLANIRYSNRALGSSMARKYANENDNFLKKLKSNIFERFLDWVVGYEKINYDSMEALLIVLCDSTNINL